MVETKEDVMEEYDQLKELVRDVMRDHEETRNSDMRLLHHVWSDRQDIDLNDPDEFASAMNPRSLIRVRAEIQNDDEELLPTDPDTLEARRVREEAVRERYGINRPDLVKEYCG